MTPRPAAVPPRAARYLAVLCLAGLAAAGCGGSSPARPAGTAGQASQPPATGAPVVKAPAAQVSALSRLAGGTSDASLAGLNACSLIPSATISQVLGHLSRPCYGPQGGTLGFFDLAGTSPRVTVSLAIVERSAFNATQAFSRSERKTARVQPVPGLGGAAFSITSSNGGPGYQLWAARGGRAVEIAVNSTSATAQQQVRDLMTGALSRL